MAILRVQVGLLSVSGVPEDTCVNTWHWLGPADEATAGTIIGGIAGGLSTIETYFSPFLSGDVDFKVYDLGTPEPRVPIVSGIETGVFDPGANGLPNEVACCLSFRAAYEAGVPRSRRRNRMYIGPLSTSCLGGESSASEGSRPNGIFTQDLLDMVETVRTNVGATAEHIVYSPTDNEANLPVLYWVDNAWDTQRRRGNAATTRDTWTP